MGRAIIIIPHERRKAARAMNSDEDGPREIPVNYSPDRKDDGGPLVWASMKAITFLIGYTTALVVVVSFVFRFIVAAENTKLRLDLAENYARKGEIIGAALYHAEQSAQDARMRAVEEEINRIREQMNKNTGRLDRLEGNSNSGSKR